MIHSADPQSGPVVITVAHVVRPSVGPFVPTFQNLAKQNKFKVKTMFTTGENVGLAEWIIDDTCLVFRYLYTCSFQKYMEYIGTWSSFFKSITSSNWMVFWYFVFVSRFLCVGHNIWNCKSASCYEIFIQAIWRGSFKCVACRGLRSNYSLILTIPQKEYHGHLNQICLFFTNQLHSHTSGDLKLLIFNEQFYSCP